MRLGSTEREGEGERAILGELWRGMRLNLYDLWIVWRRVLVCRDTSLAHLQAIRQGLLTWSAEQLHSFHL